MQRQRTAPTSLFLSSARDDGGGGGQARECVRGERSAIPWYTTDYS